MKHTLRIIKERIAGYIRKVMGNEEIPVDFTASDNVKRIYRIQKENDKKIREMNEKLSHTLQRIEEVKRHMVNTGYSTLNLDAPREEKPFNIVRKTYLNRMSSRKLNEFENIHEFIKFNRMKAITEDDIKNCNWKETFRKLCE